MSSPELEILESVVQDAPCWTELRYQDKRSQAVAVERGRIEAANSSRRAGVGVRVLEHGAFGFASTDRCEAGPLKAAIASARSSAKAAAGRRKDKIQALPKADLARGTFEERDLREIMDRPLEDKVRLALQIEEMTRKANVSIQTASCRYSEVFEEKAIVTSDGGAALTRLVRPEFRVSAVAGGGREMASGRESIGVTGGWTCLFRDASAEVLAARAAKRAVDLVHAGTPQGGPATVILSPSIVGLLAHEAIGHTVEADFVASGSVAKGKIGQRVASDLVTLCDSGHSEIADGAGGTMSVDDEGIKTGNTVIIENGFLRSYLHDRESAARHGVAPTGNARAWEYSDQPLIRMRNTFIRPGAMDLDEMIAGVEDGYLLEGAEGGQADATGEFMFGVQEARRIHKGKLGELVRGVTLSGIAFEVLKSVDAVGSVFKWDLGAGYCGKGQPAKVDAGGPYLRCRVTLGGRVA